MEFVSLTGKRRRITKPRKYLINWQNPSRSKFQTLVKQFIRKYWAGHIVFEEFPLVGSRLTLDFYNATKKVAIEVQGAQHQRFVPHFHQHVLNFGSQLKRDRDKELFCEKNGIILATVYPSDNINIELFTSQGVNL